MKKNFKIYALSWAALLAIFNLITFIIPEIPDIDKLTPSFWIGYIFITLAFVGQLACSYVVFKSDSAKKWFYRLPLTSCSYIGLISSFAVGSLCMIISPLPYWVGIILCSLVLAFNIVITFKTASTIVRLESIDNKVKVQTFFIKSLTIDADTLMASAKSEAVKAECRKVYETVRYSDPMSNDALASVESQITVKFAELSEAVKADDAAKVVELANEVIVLVGDRNKKCKLLK